MTYEDAVSRCWLEVDLDAIRENYRAACAMVGDGAQIIPVLKANAYGMNAVEVAGALKTEGAKLFAVASSDEAEQLLREHPDIEVLVMGLVGEGALRRLIAQNMPIALFSERQGEKIARIAAELGAVARVHIKVDTGLHRLGLEPDRAAEYAEKLCAGGNVCVCGLCQRHSGNQGNRSGAVPVRHGLVPEKPAGKLRHSADDYRQLVCHCGRGCHRSADWPTHGDLSVPLLSGKAA